MDKLIVRGGKPLIGEIYISGAKNAALPIMAASLLTGDPVVLSNIPYLADITTMCKLLSSHGVEISVDGTSFEHNNSGKRLILNANNIDNLVAHYDIVRKMRASIIVLGPLLTRFGYAKVSLPGGCAIGARPVDFHLKALKLMGADIELEDGYIIASAKNGLQGSDIHFDIVSVGATENAMMAATLATGTTRIFNAAKEPEVVDLGSFLISMGADIKGLGTDTIVINGVDKLHGTNYRIISDRIEAGTFAAMVGVAGGELHLKNFDIALFDSVIEKFQQIGIDIESYPDYIKITKNYPRLLPIEISTHPHPGFPTDMQAQFMGMMTIADGTSTIKENIFENRFMHVPELNRMGANIIVKGEVAIIHGKEQLQGAEVMATDLRASVSLVIAALSTKDETIINRIYHLDRGYERIEEKLANCGIDITRAI